MPNPTPTIFIVDDDASVRKGLERLLRSVNYRTEQFASASEFIVRCREGNLQGCAILDVRMPGLDGLALQQKLLDARAMIPIIFITGHGDIPMSVKAIKAGAIDFLPKPFQDEDLLAAIGQALAVGTQLDGEQAHRESLAERYASLTPREREVMTLVAAGLLNKQIASKLSASEKTIKIHRGRVMQKMSVKSVADLVRAAQKLGLPTVVASPPG